MRKDDRQGSRMSDRQMARAATSGRKMTFHFSPGDIIEGYLVGSDDFHWLIAHQDDDHQMVISLIHKGSAQRITISPNSVLDDEIASAQVFIRRIGTGFWQFCDKTYLGKNNDTPQEKAS